MKTKGKAKRHVVIPKVRRRKKLSAEQLLKTGGYISTLQAAALIGVSTLSVQRWFDAGLLSGAKLPGGKRMIAADKMQEFLDKQGIKVSGSAAAGKPVVLLVDDEASILAQMKAYLELTGKYSVQTASSGLEAGAKLVQVPPDCIVVDVLLGDVGGATLVKMIRSMDGGKKARIVAISGRASAADVDKIMKAGADAFLTKPVAMRELEQSISAGFDFVARRT